MSVLKVIQAKLEFMTDAERQKVAAWFAGGAVE